jgi:hypothetical protein
MCPADSTRIQIAPSTRSNPKKYKGLNRGEAIAQFRGGLALAYEFDHSEINLK